MLNRQSNVVINQGNDLNKGRVFILSSVAFFTQLNVDWKHLINHLCCLYFGTCQAMCFSLYN